MIPTFEKGTILRIKDYVFEDGTSKDKYLIILHKDNQSTIVIHSLTTSKKKNTNPDAQFGCNTYKKDDFVTIPYFYFPQDHVLDSDTGFYFDVDTYIFFLNNTTKVEISALKVYDNQPFGLVELGKLDDYNIKRLIKCISKSDFVPNDIKAILKG
jgi:hypothetical protein